MEWQFLTNTFVVIAQHNRARAIRISSWTDAALFQRQANAFDNALYLYFHPLHKAMMDEDAALGGQKLTQKGSTKSLDNLLADLSPNLINQWNRQISIVFAPGTPEYIALLGNGLTPFGSGKKDDIIKAVKTLGENLAGIVALAAVKTAVDAYYTLLNNARTGQKGNITDTKGESDQLTDKTMAAMVGLYAVLGACMQEYAATPMDIKPYFDIQSIRDLEQTVFIHTIPAGADPTAFIFKRTLEPGKQVKVTVLSPNATDFYIADEKNDPVRDKKVTVDGLEDETIPVENLGNVPVAKYFKVHTTDNSVDTHIKIEIL
jgi:hypothetical protein